MKLNKPFFIAEISANHCGSLKIAKKLIDDAKKYGADAVKLQTYTPDTMTLNIKKKKFLINNGLWKGKKLWDLYNIAQTPYEWHKILFSYARKKKIECFSTPFDESAVDFLEKLNCPYYKVSSFEMTDIPLIKKIAKTKKKMIISTGMANINEIKKTYDVAKKNGAKEIILLYCVSNYPSKLSDFNLNNIKIMKKKFKCIVGLSDHSKNNLVAKLAVAVGAKVFEKHIALKRYNKSPDYDFSIKGEEIRKYREDLNLSFQLLGKKKFFRTKSELANKKFRRSIYVVKDIKKGEKFSKINLKKIRPGYGLDPLYYESILKKRAYKNFYKGSPLNRKDLQKLKLKRF
tara:strand:+ start:12404 stop:13438 length:1035 start_codon:yes stop_codon:yes gene_type:complete